MTAADKSLTQRLDEIRARASAQSATVYDALVKRLVDSGAMDGALKEGAVFPDFQLASAEGRLIRRSDILAEGPAVVTFYRGAWCPYCSETLNALADVTPQIQAAGARVVAITPEAGGRALRTKFDRGFAFEILCDLDNVLAAECGLLFPVPDDLRRLYMENNNDFELVYGNGAWMLPAPATYVVSRDGIVAKAYVNPDFRYRMGPPEIVAAVQALR